MLTTGIKDNGTLGFLCLWQLRWVLVLNFGVKGKGTSFSFLCLNMAPGFGLGTEVGLEHDPREPEFSRRLLEIFHSNCSSDVPWIGPERAAAQLQMQVFALGPCEDTATFP